MSVEHHTEGNAFIENTAVNLSPAFDASVQTGRAVALGADNDLPIHIHYTLGDEENSVPQMTSDTAPSGEASASSSYGGASEYEAYRCFNRTNADDTDCWFSNASTGWVQYENTKNYVLNSVNITTQNHGSGGIYGPREFTIQGSNNGTDWTIISTHTGVTWANGNETQSFTSSDGNGYLYYKLDCTVSGAYIGIGKLEFIGQEITSMANSFLTYHDLDTNEVIQIDNSLNTPTTTYTFNDVTLNNILTHKTALDATSLANIQAEPNLLAELGINGSAVGVNITLDADDSYYAVSEESGADVFDARYTNDTAITGDLTNVRINGQSKGLQTTALVLNASGVPTAYNDTAGTAKVYSDTIINTGFKPNIGRYSIDETVSGELQDFGSELVINGTFDTGILNWNSGYSTPDLTHENSNSLKISGISSEAFSGSGDLNSTLTNGSTYLISFTVIDSNIVRMSVGLSTTLIGLAANADISDEIDISNDSNTERSISITTTRDNINYIVFWQNAGSSPDKYMVIDNVSVKEITTKTQRTERRVLTHDVTATPQDHYYIGTDGGAMVEQSVVPALPSPTTVIDLNDTPVIGYADTIDTRHDQFVITSTVITP